MIYIILAIVLLYIVVFGLSFLFGLRAKEVSCDLSKQKKKLDFSIATPSYICSRLLWSLVICLAIVYCLTLALPIVWTLFSSVKEKLDFSLNPFGFPKSWMFENYAIVLDKLVISDGLKTYGILDMFLNSVIYAGIAPLVSIFWMTVVAYVMSRFKFFGNKFLYNLGLLIMFLPIVGNIASQMIIYKNWGLYDNLYLMIFMPPSTAFSGLNFMILYGALKGIPQTYTEAAQLDGASNYRIMFQIIIPMVLPTCATLYILTFFTNWNAYESFLVWYPSTPNIAYGMYRFQYDSTSGSSPATDPQILAGFIMIMIPSLIIYLCSQKLLKANFMVGGLKG